MKVLKGYIMGLLTLKVWVHTHTHTHTHIFSKIAFKVTGIYEFSKEGIYE
jgi:hypothetical protein